MRLAMEKEILIRVPRSLYEEAKLICQREYKSMSSLIRELLFEKAQEILTDRELHMIEKQSREFHEGKGAAWRKIKRG